jgi:hypothetical protein
MIDELKKWKFDDTYAEEESEQIQGAEIIERKSEKFKSLVKSNKWHITVSKNTRKAKWVQATMQTKKNEFYKDEKDKKKTNGSQVSAINNSFFGLTVSDGNNKQYLVAKVFEKDVMLFSKNQQMWSR